MTCSVPVIQRSLGGIILTNNRVPAPRPGAMDYSNYIQANMATSPAHIFHLALRVFAVLVALIPFSLAGAADIRQEDLDGSLVAAASAADMNSFNIALKLGANLNAIDAHGNNVVLAATLGNHTELLRTLLEKGVNPGIVGSSGFAPLAYASMVGSVRNVQLLIKAGADPNQRTALGETPMHLAAEFGRTDIIALLAAAGARIDARNAARETPLMAAIRANKADAFDALLSRGADTNVSDKDDRSALFLAILEDHEEMALTLVEKDAGFARRPRQYTPLQMARFMGHRRVVAALENRGASE